ncbi:Gfo/Idh/MocA family oxidoreductase [Rhizobium sp. CG5]|uniref:Gfo/Idh/MocA family protein n=1 Tax=Rhizobium sp. CG5 TaxID=2726076 RepID=UPI002033EFA0|nr:Gfo/Idh/MocA family oxidoreductase [Rhizobium sp. CG5]MCM2477713.1 Gfo/Idh/MocA family oxidoreductase [Rhizobium sp. CG5]
MTYNIVVHGCRHPHWRDYVDQVERTDGFRISHIWDRDEQSLSAALSATGAQKFEPATPIKGASAILLLSETSFHVEDLAAILAWHLPMFIEKPLGASTTNVLLVSKAVADSGLPFHTGFFLRTVPALAKARKLIGSGKLGSIGYVRIRFAHNGVRAGWLRDNWILEPKFAGVGGFGDLAIHCIDLLQWWGLRPLVKGPSSYANIMGRTEAEDFGVSLVSYPGGTAVVEAGWVAGDGPILDIEVLGSRGTLRMRGEHLVVQIGDCGDNTNLGAVELDAGMGLRPFLHGISNGDWSECVAIDESVEANLVALGLKNEIEEP